jgi:hypothetical protein
MSQHSAFGCNHRDEKNIPMIFMDFDYAGILDRVIIVKLFF